jgi:hypothetical protein
MSIVQLKGGSLSSTFLVDQSFIRKEISTKSDREYGYVRWYSQLKKLQRYSKDFPDLFPKVLQVGYDNDRAYFDIEYFPDAQDIKNLFINRNLDASEIKNINTALWNAFNELHSVTFSANKGACLLYFKEEVSQKLADAKQSSKEFADFCRYETYFYNGQEVPNLNDYLYLLEAYFKNINIAEEQFIHGNPTLENTLYITKEDRIVFIDLYEESIIDSKFLDYSQVLQCSRSHYGFLNDNDKQVEGNAVSHNLTIPASFSIFNAYFEARLRQDLNAKELKLVDILEATQFIRMLPFKCYVRNLNDAKFFYVHACYLLSKIYN